jgi:enterochelin esterase-like enzyme
MIENRECQEALRGMQGVYIDVGRSDQYNTQYGNRRLGAKLETLGIDCHYEEFDGTHSSIDWRLDTSMPWLARRLSAAE